MPAEAPIRFVDLPAQYADIEKDILAAVAEIIRKGAFVGGPAAADFEAALARYCSVKFAVGCSDGTMALEDKAVVVAGCGEMPLSPHASRAHCLRAALSPP